VGQCGRVSQQQALRRFRKICPLISVALKPWDVTWRAHSGCESENRISRKISKNPLSSRRIDPVSDPESRAVRVPEQELQQGVHIIMIRYTLKQGHLDSQPSLSCS